MTERFCQNSFENYFDRISLGLDNPSMAYFGYKNKAVGNQKI